MIKKEDVFEIGRFTKPHGIKGEIGLMTTRHNLFEEPDDDPYIFCEIKGILVPFYVEEYRYKTDTVILIKMENVDSGEKAKEFINRIAYSPLAAANEPDAAFTWDHFTGYTVFDPEYGLLGVVKEVDHSTMNVLFRLDHEGKEVLIPVADELILSLDHSEKYLTISVPKGLLEL